MDKGKRWKRKWKEREGIDGMGERGLETIGGIQVECLVCSFEVLTKRGGGGGGGVGLVGCLFNIPATC